MLTADGTSSVSEIASAFLSHLRYEQIPKSVIQRAKLLILDAIGTALAASITEWGKTSAKVALRLGGDAESTLIGTASKLGMVNAALANGCLVHGLDYDDTYFGAIVHPSCCVVPAGLAAGEAAKKNGKEVLVGIVAGYELLLRVALGGKDNLFRENYHTTGLMGPIGAAMACARTLDLGPTVTTNALGIAAGLGGGILQSMREGQHVKALQAGYAAHGGVLAVLLAAEGVAGPRQAFEGELGFYKTYLNSGNYDASLVTNTLGAAWYTSDISLKMYPGAHRHHFFVESALVLKAQNSIDVDDIAEICCVSSPAHQYYNFTPAGRRPTNTHVARFSVPFLIATALVNGRLDTKSFSPASIADERILQLAERVGHTIESDADRPDKRGHVIIKLRDGRAFENIQSYIRGLPENPASEKDVHEKFFANVEDVIGIERAGVLLQAISNFDQVVDVSGMLAIAGS